MKTKTIIMLCLLSGFGLAQLSAQNGKNGTGAVTEKTTWDAYYLDIPVNCNNAVVDRLVGPVKMYNVYHYKDGVCLWIKQQYDAVVTSSIPPYEVFAVNDMCKYDMITLIGYGHCNLIGNYGSHYILTYMFNVVTEEFTFGKCICH